MSATKKQKTTMAASSSSSSSAAAASDHPSWVAYDPATCDFPVQNLPYGVFTPPAGGQPVAMTRRTLRAGKTLQLKSKLKLQLELE